VDVAEGRDVRGAERLTDVVVQELAGQQRTPQGRTTTVTVVGKPKVSDVYCVLQKNVIVTGLSSLF